MAVSIDDNQRDKRAGTKAHLWRRFYRKCLILAATFTTTCSIFAAASLLTYLEWNVLTSGAGSAALRSIQKHWQQHGRSTCESV